MATKKERHAETPEITCLGVHCGKMIQLPSYINNEQYDGDLRCQKCLSLMHITLRKGVVVKYSLKKDNSDTAEGWENWAILRAAALKEDNNE